MTLYDKCVLYGVATGSRIICPDQEWGKYTDYDFVMTDRAFFRAFTDEEIDSFKVAGMNGGSFKKVKLEGYTFRDGDKNIDIIIVSSQNEQKIWEYATKTCIGINAFFSLRSKPRRILFFEKMVDTFSEHIQSEDA